MSDGRQDLVDMDRKVCMLWRKFPSILLTLFQHHLNKLSGETGRRGDGEMRSISASVMMNTDLLRTSRLDGSSALATLPFEFFLTAKASLEFGGRPECANQTSASETWSNSNLVQQC